MMTHNYTYAELYRAADKLWPGEADIILDNPTEDQLALILAVLHSSPVGGWSVTGMAAAFTNMTHA
jgi:hypothetical protein